MATNILEQYQASSQLAKINAQSKLIDSFKKDQVQYLKYFSFDIEQYLLDYFILLDDLTYRITPGENVRKAFSDYSFVILPVHKALEMYIRGFFSILGVKISTKKDKTLGYYLNLPDKKKREILKKAGTESLPWKGTEYKITEEGWVDAWNLLCESWSNDRNPLIHPEEKIESLREAEDAAGTIRTRIKQTLSLFIDEWIKPVIKIIEEIEKEKSKEKK